MPELIFIQTDIEATQETLSVEESETKIIIYGNKLDGKPVKVHVKHFVPYFYVKASNPVDANDLENIVKRSFTRGRCVGIKSVMKQSIYGYSVEPEQFFQVFFESHTCFRQAREFFKGGVLINGLRIRFTTFESTCPIVLRFMNDYNVSGMSYIRVREYDQIQGDSPSVPEFVTDVDFIEALPLEKDFLKIPPLKLLSFDIECCGDTSAFPDSKKDPVIQIGNTVQIYGSEAYKSVIFCLKETANIPGREVRSFEREKDLLQAWYDFFMEENPDIICGYNIKGFDFPYLFDRAEVYKLSEFGKLGRSRRLSKIVNRQQSSKAFGSFDAKDIYIDGRLIFDLLHIIRREHKLRSYSLNAVSLYFLGEQKEDVPYSSIASLQNGDPETRRRVASYCLRDTLLPLRLLDKLNILVNYTELSRVTYVPISFFTTRGAAIKVLAQIYKEASSTTFIIPDIDRSNDEMSYEGAFVIDPVKGFYPNPIAVLDFCSLYPSIMISKNLCYTTLLSRAQYEEIGGLKTPTGDYFCTADVKEGLVPRILRNLIAARKEARKKLAAESDPGLRRALEARQYALKICANSIYGFTGAPAGQLPCIPISQSTTGYGRCMISETKKLIEENFCTSQGYPFDSQVIYGDTDSVMVNFLYKENEDCKKRLKDLHEVAGKIADLVTSKFERPVALAFEKIYYPYLLMNKKRYAGLICTPDGKQGKIDMKGIETIRRDNCELVKNLVQACLDKMLLERDIDGAIKHVKETVTRLYKDEIDMSQLVISKTYTKAEYATKQTHSELVEKLRQRGQEVAIGDRIPYVIIKGDRKALAHERSEDPLYVIQNELPIDKDYYIHQQLYKPIQRIFEPIMDNVACLFSGDHTRNVERTQSTKGPLNTFFKASEGCVGCGKAGGFVCKECMKDVPNLYKETLSSFNEKTKRFSECWVECQRCQGSLLNEVLCVNRICPIWYMRTKIKKEIIPLSEKLEKFRDLSW